MFGKKTIKIIFIEGMSCGHCSKRVEDALKSVKEVKSISVSLEKKMAEVTLKTNVDNEILKTVVEDVGFEVTNIE